MFSVVFFCFLFLPQSASYICSGRMSSVRWHRSELPDTAGALPRKALPPETPKLRRLLTKVPSAGIHWLRWYPLPTAPAVLSMSFFAYHTPNTYSFSIQPRVLKFSVFILKATGGNTKSSNTVCYTQWPNM